MNKEDNKSILKLVQFTSICILLVVGVLNPNSKLDVTVSLLIFGVFLSFYVNIFLRQNKLNIFLKRASYLIFLTCLAIVFFAISKQKPYLWDLAILSAGLGILLSFKFLKCLLSHPQVLLFFLIFIFLITSYTNSFNLRNLIKQEPQAESYFTDHLDFLRVYYLIGQGFDYYPALVKAYIEDGRGDAIPKKSWYWRLPTYAYFWNLFPGRTGISIYIAFMTLSTFMLIFAYKIARIFLPSNLASLSPYLVFPYYHFAARDIAFLEMEWWGVSFLIIGTYFILKSRHAVSFFFLIFAVFFKETFMIYIATIGLLSFLHKSKKVFYMTILIAASLGAYLVFHFLNINSYTRQGLSGLTPTSHPAGLFFLQQTLSYGSWEYLFFGLRPFTLLLFLNLFSAVFLFFRKKINFNLSMITIPVFVFAISLIKIGSIPHNDYWGATYLPLILIISPILLLKALKFD